ncbi:MAG: hypothetical protein JWM86_1321 [Thermoleophilia bacterium]|nr:hypothetical protein [Thermoleophilia bacterium]
MPVSSKKPYRVYRQPRRVRGDGTIPWGEVGQTGPGRPGPSTPRRVLRFVRRAAFVAVALALVWATIAFLSFRSAVEERNDALPQDVRAALAPADGPALSSSHVTMLVGADTSAHRRSTGEEKAGRADTMLLMRVDVPSRTVSMLSIPRDLYVEIPGYGRERINAAYSNGGLPLAIRTVRKVTGIEVNHVAQIDFDGFKEVVDALDGVTVQNPRTFSSSNYFDGGKWYFPKGELHLTGKQALAYARLRKTRNVEESTDLARAARQQRVVDAIVSEVMSAQSIKHPRGVPKAVVQPLLTDISASQMLTFGFGKWWSKPDNSLRCRLGGDQGLGDKGEDVLLPNESNRATVRMFLGRQAPLAPESPLSAGCVRSGK